MNDVKMIVEKYRSYLLNPEFDINYKILLNEILIDEIKK